VSKSLTIECERVAEASAVNPLDQRTWAATRIFAGGKCVTALLDRATGKETSTIYIPLFSLAQWVVMNWWMLLNETCRWERPPVPGKPWSSEEEAWVQRHSIRAADSGVLLPRLILYADGRHICADWLRDEDDAYPNMPGQFLYSSRELLDRGGVESAFSELITKVLTWSGQSNEDLRVDALRSNWEAISNADAAETDFCNAAGRLGVDPYATREAGLLEFLERAGEDRSQQSLFNDVLDAGSPDSAAELWQWASEIQLNRAPSIIVPAPPLSLLAAKAGYQVARQWRNAMGLAPDTPIADLSQPSKKMGIPNLKFEERNHIPSRRVRAAVGWRGDREIVLTGPNPERQESFRFLAARGLFHAAYACSDGARLVTDVRNWDQQCSRAFAAELLIPQEVVLDELSSESDSDAFERRAEKLASTFNVSTRAVYWQFQNGSRAN
jgi:Zn-dependent peptidase ImmA (M78 family)